jgi:hypothetical protein
MTRRTTLAVALLAVALLALAADARGFLGGAVLRLVPEDEADRGSEGGTNEADCDRVLAAHRGERSSRW